MDVISSGVLFYEMKQEREAGGDNNEIILRDYCELRTAPCRVTAVYPYMGEASSVQTEEVSVFHTYKLQRCAIVLLDLVRT